MPTKFDRILVAIALTSGTLFLTIVVTNIVKTLIKLSF